MKKALITGITGQDGSYLAEFLLEKGYEVHGLLRRSSNINTGRIDHLYNDPAVYGVKLFLHYGDLVDSSNLNRVVEKVGPDEIYNLGAQSHVKVSFEVPESTADVTAVGALRLLDTIKDAGMKTKFYQASTSEMFGGFPGTAPQDEKTPLHPRSPYGAAKLYAHWMTINYRESYGMFAASGILFNHESPRRGRTFVTRKVTAGVADILAGRRDKIALGNLDARRDWGYAPDYVRAMWMMLQHSKPDDFVIATGETHSVRELCALAFAQAGIELEWKGTGAQERGVERGTGRERVVVDPRYFRPAEVDLLQGNPAKAARELGWKPSVGFRELVRIMVEADRSALSVPAA